MSYDLLVVETETGKIMETHEFLNSSFTWVLAFGNSALWGYGPKYHTEILPKN